MPWQQTIMRWLGVGNFDDILRALTIKRVFVVEQHPLVEQRLILIHHVLDVSYWLPERQ